MPVDSGQVLSCFLSRPAPLSNGALAQALELDAAGHPRGREHGTAAFRPETSMGTCQQLRPVKGDTQCVTVEQSLQLTRNLMRIALFNIAYIRGLFPDKYFVDKFVPALEMYIKKLLPLDNESRRLIDWMEKGVYDALFKKYLKTLLFSVCNADQSLLIEEYSFSFSYCLESSKDVSMDITRNGDGRRGRAFSTSTSEDISPTQMKNSACKMIRTLVSLMQTLNHIPDERTILMKLFYYDDVTPSDYEPPFFRACSDEEKLFWSHAPLKLKVGGVDSKYFAMSLKVKSTLDPCEDDNNTMKEDNGPFLGCQDSETSVSEGDQHSDANTVPVPTSAPNIKDGNEACTMDEDTNDLLGPHLAAAQPTISILQDDGRLELVQQWLLSRDMNEFDKFDVLHNFPHIFTIEIEEILSRLVQQQVIRLTRKDHYVLTAEEIGSRGRHVGDVPIRTHLNACGDELSTQLMRTTAVKGALILEDESANLYLQALSHVLPMEFVTTAQLHHKLGRPPMPTIRKLMDRMANEGLIEKVSSNRRLGRRVLHSKTSETKLREVRKILNAESQVLQALEHCTIAGAREHHIIAEEGSEKLKSDNDPSGQAVKPQTTPNQAFHGVSGQKRPSPDRSDAVAKPTVSQQSARRCVAKLANPHPESGMVSNNQKISLVSEEGLRKASKVKDPIFQLAKRLRSEP